MSKRVEFEVKTTTEPTLPVVAVTGELDISTLPRLLDAAAALENEPELVIDLTNVTFIDSSSINSILRLNRKHNAAGHRLYVVAPSSNRNLTMVLTVLGVDAALDIRESIDEIKS